MLVQHDDDLGSVSYLTFTVDGVLGYLQRYESEEPGALTFFLDLDAAREHNPKLGAYVTSVFGVLYTEQLLLRAPEMLWAASSRELHEWRASGPFRKKTREGAGPLTADDWETLLEAPSKSESSRRIGAL